MMQVKADDRLRGGLYFQSFEVDKDKRTCLHLTPDHALKLGNGFIMEFDLNLRVEAHNFGYVFRLICNDTLNIDLLSNITSEETNYSLIARNQTLIEYRNSEINFTPGNWIKVWLRFDPSKNVIDISLNGVEKTAHYVLSKPKQLYVYFGSNSHDIFSTTDIAPMTIRNIIIYDITSRPVRYWKLASHGHNAVYDEYVHSRAVVSNPQWIIDHHVKWKKRISYILPNTHYDITFDPINDRIFIVKDKQIFIYHAKSQKTDTIEVRRGVPFNTEFSQMEYNPVKNELISYHFESNHLATFDFNTLEWNNENKSLVIPHHGHHSHSYLMNDSMLVTFGGYGFHRYNSILNKYNSITGTWENYDLSPYITPRYLGSMGYLGENKILFFGGFGNISGRQEEFPRNYYDLFSIDINKLKVQKIWELPNPKEHFTNSNSLVIDESNRKFYALAYPNKRYASVIKLHEYHLDKPEYRVVGDSIPYFFNDIESYCNLFLSSDSAELYAITSNIKKNTTEINIYSIAVPTLSTDEVIQHPLSKSYTWIWIWTIITCSIAVFVIFQIKNCKRTPAANDKDGDKKASDLKEKPVVYHNALVENKHSSIHLLGNFQIVDENGHDITKNLTPTTTQFFLLLLMSTIRNGKGITSGELREILWFDKSDESARNNRNVYTAKLRTTLKSLAKVRVVYHEGYWSIQTDETVFCDYERVFILMKILKTSNRFNKKILVELIDIALQGTLLPHIQQIEWFEPYQSNYTSQLIECLMEYSKHDEVKSDMLLLLKIADVILLHDIIDEDAVRLKCYALFNLGRKNLALQAFNKYTTDYERLLATKHHLVFEELMKPIQ